MALGVTIWHGKLCYNIRVMGDVAVTHGSAKNQTVTQKNQTVTKKAYSDSDSDSEIDSDSDSGSGSKGWNPLLSPL